jgi:3-deoxy-D-manno-octulosonate 8-phosphate phosphatase (KDO 8-P phosphatase)
MEKKVGFLDEPSKKKNIIQPSVLARVNASVRARIEKVRVLGLDVDGVMTDGRLYYHDDGTETKAFDVKDGHGIKMLQHAGIEVFLISGRSSPMVEKRATDLGITDITQGVRDKIPALDRIVEERGLDLTQVAFMGDDIVDIPILSKVGFAVAVADALEYVIEKAHYVTLAPGGRGAVREVIELILAVQGKWEKIAERYFL